MSEIPTKSESLLAEIRDVLKAERQLALVGYLLAAITIVNFLKLFQGKKR